MNNANNSAASVELSLHIDNTEYLCNQKLFIFKNYAKKQVKGLFDYELAIKGMMHLVNRAAKEYAMENGSMADSWSRMFPMSDRKTVAEDLVKEFKDWFATDYVA